LEIVKVFSSPSSYHHHDDDDHCCYDLPYSSGGSSGSSSGGGHVWWEVREDEDHGVMKSLQEVGITLTHMTPEEDIITNRGEGEWWWWW